MLKAFQIQRGEVTAVTFDPIVLLLLGLLIGLLMSLIIIGVWSARTHPHNWDWLVAHDRVMGGLLILAAFALGVFAAFVVLR